MLATAQPTLFQNETRSASLDRRRIYRYELWRQWTVEPPRRFVNFVCLNPSTADENTDDPTVRKAVKFACSWGFDALCITNLFAYRATDPRAMMKAADPVGFGNDRHILKVAREDSLVVCAWSLDGSFMNRGAIVRSAIAKFDPHYLRLTREQPWHPLYLPDNTRPSRWYSEGYFKKQETK